MAITIRMDGAGADEELRSLYDWLQSDLKIRRYARVSLRSTEPKPGEMGTALGAVQLVLDNGFDTAELMFTYLAWRAARGGRSNGTIERGETKIPLSDASEESAESIAKKLDSDES